MAKNKPSNSKNPSLIINNKSGSDEHIIFDFCNFNFKSTRIETFTNYLKDKEEFTRDINFIFHEAIPLLQSKKFSEIMNSSYNYHVIKGDQLKTVKAIMKDYNPRIDYDDNSLIQFSSGIRGVRFIGERQENIFKILFIDFHHLLCPSQKYNNTDYGNNSFCILNLK